MGLQGWVFLCLTKAKALVSHLPVYVKSGAAAEKKRAWHVKKDGGC